MRISFYAHASFRLETPDVSLVTDPYTPGPTVSNFAPIDEPADIVVMSSSTDRFHSDPSHVRGDPVVIDALTLPTEGTVVRGVPIRPFPAGESLTFDYGRDPDANAMYLMTIDGLRVLHMGDAGNAVNPAHLAALAGGVDILFALAGAHATLSLDDLDDAIAAIGPRLVIPMHYWHPRGRLRIEPVDRFLERHGTDNVVRVGGPSIAVTRDTLPKERRIVVLDQTR